MHPPQPRSGSDGRRCAVGGHHPGITSDHDGGERLVHLEMDSQKHRKSSDPAFALVFYLGDNYLNPS